MATAKLDICNVSYVGACACMFPSINCEFIDFELLKVTRPSFFGGVPSYFEALWYPHLYFYRKSNT